MPDLWQQALGELALQMTRATFDTWLRGSTVVDQSDDELIVGVKSTYALDWLANRLATTITRVVSRLAGHPIVVRFVIATPAHVDEAEPIDEMIVEAVREERVVVQPGAQPLCWNDFYIKLKVAFRKTALRRLKGAPLSVFLCLALHVDRDGVAAPGVETIMRETDYSRSVVCNALDSLVALGLLAKRPSFRGNDEYIVRGYAWFGQSPAPALWEE